MRTSDSFTMLGITQDPGWYPPVATNHDCDRPYQISERQWLALLKCLEVARLDASEAIRPTDLASWLEGLEAGTKAALPYAENPQFSVMQQSPEYGRQAMSASLPEKSSGRETATSSASESSVGWFAT